MNNEFTNLSNGFLNLTTEYTKNNPEDKSNIWSILLNYLYNENSKIGHYGIRQKDVVTNTIWDEINSYSDFSDDFFSSIYSEIIKDLNIFQNNNLTNNGDYTERVAPLWNESVEKMLQYFYQHIDSQGMANFENSGYLIEDEEGNIDLDYLKDSIPVSGGANMRAIDVKKADAANSFVKESEIYESKEIIIDGINTILNRVVTNPWVVPWYNINGHSYRYVREQDRINGVLSNSEKLQFTRTQDEAATFSKNKYIRLIMPTYKRRVEIEDLDRNFWVIAQTITAISAYLFDEDAPIPKMFKDLLNEVMQLWENVLYLWAAVTALGETPYYTNVHTEVVYLTNSEAQSYLKYDNFGNTYTINEDEIKNRLYYLIQTYTDSNLCIIPIIRNDNYEKNYYSEEIYPFILTFNRNIDNDFQIEYYVGYSSGIKINLNTNNINQKLYAIREEENTYNYFSPYSKVNDTEDGIYTNYVQKYYALLRTKVNFSNDLPKLVDNKIDWSGLKIELQDGAKSIINESDVWYQYYPVNQINTMPANSIVVSSKNINLGYYMGELISGYKTSNVINWDLTFNTVTLVPYINGEDYFGETNVTADIDWVQKHLSDIQEDSSLVLEKYAKEYLSSDKYQIQLYTGEHIYDTEIDQSRIIRYYYLNDDSTLSNREIGVVNTQGVTIGAVLYIPLNSSYNSYEKYYYYSDYWISPPNTYWNFGGENRQGLSNSRIDIYYKGDKLTENNWMIRYTQIGAEAVTDNLGNETLIKLSEPYDSNEYAVVKTLSISYFMANGNFYEKFVKRNVSSISTLNQYVEIYDYNWESRPNLSEYTLYRNPQFIGVIFKGNRQGDYEFHWQDGYNGSGI